MPVRKTHNVLAADMYPSLSLSNFIIAVEKEPYGIFSVVKRIATAEVEAYTVLMPYSSVVSILAKRGKVISDMHFWRTLQIT